MSSKFPRMLVWLVLIFVLGVVLSGCASLPGVAMTDDERKACEASGCTVWTQRQLEGLARRFFQQGYNAGVKSI